MKKLLLIVFFFFLFGCQSERDKQILKAENTPTIGGDKLGLTGDPVWTDHGYQIISIDSCEYIYAWTGNASGGGTLTHKGNCKFCKQRSKQP